MTTVEFAPTAVKIPERPSKYDIIPVHNSDRSSFKFCRRQWAWSSPNRMNLVPRVTVYGMNKSARNLWFGTGIHHALEQYYHPGIRQDPAVAWETWFNLQWLGGVVSEDEIKEFVDRNPQPFYSTFDDGNTYQTGYKVEGLADILPDFGEDNEEIFLGLKDLGVGMMKFYKDYAEAHDNFTVVMVEHDFSVPVLNEKGEPLYAVDTRIMPEGWEPNFEIGNEFGHLMKEVTPPDQGYDYDYDTPWLMKQVHVRGRMDQIQQEHEYGRYGIMDYKTASRVDDDYFKHLELDEQCTSYLAFGQLEAQLHDLPYKQLEYIVYQAMLKGYPKPPTILKNGLPSTNRQTETTNAKMFEAYILNNGLKPLYDADEKLQRYYAYLLKMGDDLYIQRNDTWRNASQRINAMTRLYYEARDMLGNPVLYPNPSKNFQCINCAFRLPCIQAETGDDFMDTLTNGYIENWDR